MSEARRYLDVFMQYLKNNGKLRGTIDTDSKDIMRLEKIYSFPTEEKKIQMASNQGNKIRDPRKACRRAKAAIEVGEDVGANEDTVLAIVKAFTLSAAMGVGFNPIQIAQARMKIEGQIK